MLREDARFRAEAHNLMHILTASEMRDADRRTIEEIGVPARVLMENAGRAIVQIMEESIAGLDGCSIAIVCGKGNNGGDGLVVLRTLIGLGYDARAWVLSPFERLSENAIDNLQAALKLSLPVDAVTTEEEWADALIHIAPADVIVDAIFGTGLSRAAEGLPRRAIEDLHALPAFKVAVDVPSGLPSDGPPLQGPAIEADLTVALGAPKICHFIPPACEACGDVEVAEIGIPPELLLSSEPTVETLESLDVSLLLRDRPRSSHKGDFGHVLVVAGSTGKTGAAVMAAQAALRSGAGLVTVATAASAIPVMAAQIPEVMWEALPETSSGGIAAAAFERIAELSQNRNAMILGPGLGLDEETVELARRLVYEGRLPTVVDADGLGALVGSRAPVPSQHIVALTPHPGEAGRLLGCSTAAVQRDRIKAVRGLASSWRTPVVLKGFRTLISTKTGRLKVNLTGNAGMATAGSGDVLSGIIGGLLAQGVSMVEALNLGVHLHGRAGDLAAEELGEASLIATDITHKLAAAFEQLETETH